jgi:Protein of unknown function (DUF3987)
MTPTQTLKHLNLDGLKHIPEKLQGLQQAITWQAGKLDTTTGKFQKYPKGKDGTGAHWPQPKQWVGNLSSAIRVAEKRGHDGPGLVLPATIDGMHLVALDWDGVDFNDAHRMDEIHQDWISLGKPYTEISPSGKGLRAFVLSTTPVKEASCARPSGGKDELFCSSKARWMTVTGELFWEGGLPEATQAVLVLSAKWNAHKPLATHAKTYKTVEKPCQPSILSHLLADGGFKWPDQLLTDGDGREKTMLAYAGHLRQLGHSQDEIEKLCLLANHERYAAPLTDTVVLDRARRYAAPSNETTDVAFDDWGELIDLPPKYRPTPSMDTNLLPPSIGRYVEDCAGRMRIPAEMIASPLLVALGSVFGKKVCIQPRSKDTNWLEYPNLWGVSILPPAMLKSPSLNAAMKFINELEAKAQGEHVIAMAAWDSDERVRKLELKLLESQARSAIKSGDKTGAKQMLDRAHLVSPPIRKRFVISDATPEARLEILCNNPNGVLLLRDELDGHIAQLKKDGYENARAQELQFFDGHQDYSDDRIKRGSHMAEGPRMALYGNLQPAKVEKYLSDLHKGGSDDGYLQRIFQLAIQPTITNDFELTDAQPDFDAENSVRNLFYAANALPLERNALTQRITPKVLKFEPQAQKQFDQFLVTLENKLRSGGISNPMLAAHLGKYRGTLAKIALILALAVDPMANSVSLEAFEKASQLLMFYVEHAKRIYGVVTRPELTAAHALLDRIKVGQLNNGFNSRDDILRKEWSGLRSASEVDAGVELLVKHNHLRVVEESTNGRPKRTMLIHPKLLRQKGQKVGVD